MVLWAGHKEAILCMIKGLVPPRSELWGSKEDAFNTWRAMERPQEAEWPSLWRVSVLCLRKTFENGGS